MKVSVAGTTQVEVEIEDGTLLDAAFASSPAESKHTCRGHGRCGACLVAIEEGLENLSRPSEAESRILHILRADPNQRLACQARISGDVVCRP